jgi:hypothetical protein
MLANRRLGRRPGLMLVLLPAAILLAACSSTKPTTTAAVTAGGGRSAPPNSSAPIMGTAPAIGAASSAAAPTGAAAASGAGATATSTPLDSAPVVVLTPTLAASETPEPVTGSRTAKGDVPDNAIYLTYKDAARPYSIQYVEGWQVAPQPDGVTIADKDSSEKVQIVAGADPATYVTSVDLPALKAMPAFSLIKHDRVSVKGRTYEHLEYHAVSDPDPVTGKEIPSTVDRYYVPGSGQLAVVTLSTPDGVDNVDAFRLMIESFTWR